MSNVPIKIIKEYHAKEFGLNVIIKNVPVIEVQGLEVLDINFDKISKTLFDALITKQFTLTGSEVRFMRLFMGLTIEALANCLHVTHPTVIGWEKCRDEPTKMTDTTEAMLRLYAARIGSKDPELITNILEKFFIGPKKEATLKRSETIIELSPFGKKSSPKVRFEAKQAR